MTRPRKLITLPDRHAKPLYAQHAQVLSLDLDKAERFCIERKDAPTLHVPLRLVSRLVCAAHTHVHSRVWMACMRHGIPLMVVEAGGQVLGWSFGTRRTECSLRLLLLHAQEDPQWPELFDAWHRLQAAAITAQNLLLCNVPATPQARQHPRAALCNAHFSRHQLPTGDHVDAVGHLARYELAALLAQETGDPELLAWYRPGFNLIDALGDLLALHAHTDVHHAGRLPAAADVPPWAVRFYERHASHWQSRLAHLMVSFEQFLRRHWL